MTQYLVTAWKDQNVRELWAAVEKHGQSITDANFYKYELSKLFKDFSYTVRPVTDEKVKEMVLA